MESLKLALFLCLAAITVTLTSRVSGEQCPKNGSCPLVPDHDIDLSPLQGTWDTLYYTQTPGSLVANIPNFFNISLCGRLQDSPCTNSSVCYSSGLDVFYNLGNTSSCQYSYEDRKIAFNFAFSSEDSVRRRFGTGNVSVTLICGRTLGTPEVIMGDPSSREVIIVWETSAACKTSSSLHYTSETKCYHIHTNNEHGLRANFIDLTSLIRPKGYQVVNSENDQFKFLLSICKPMVLGAGHESHGACNGSMMCLVEKGSSLGDGVPMVLGNWSSALESRLHMHEGLLTMQYSVSVNPGACGSVRNVTIHFLCPSGNQELGPHVTFMDSQVCLTIVTWYTSFACGQSAIQAPGCYLAAQGGVTFNLTSLSSAVIQVNSSSQVDLLGHPYTYSLQICRGNSLYDGCSPPPASGTRVVQSDTEGVCRSLGEDPGILRYAEGTLSLTYSHGDSCHSNFARTSSITFLCPENLDKESANTSSVRFLGEEDCFYEFEWITPLACGTKTSGVSDCQFKLSHGGVYNFAPLVGTEDKNWVAIASDRDIACFMINPCGELVVTKNAHATGMEYCNKRHAPFGCSGASVCEIAADGTAKMIGKFDLGNTANIVSADSNVVTVSGGIERKNITAVIHYVCKTGDLFSAPVYVGLTNRYFYEFHWTTFAACPSGIQSGSECTVSYQGFLFNLTSIPVLTFVSVGYTYQLSVCSALRSNVTRCNSGNSTNAAICQVQNSGGNHYKLGEANSTLVYEDGSLKLVYKNGQKCHHGSRPARNTTVLFICDSTAHTASISSVTEDHCEYVVEVRTKLACPPANRATECIYLNGTQSYDFSDLSRSLDQGNWETRGPDGSVYYINICQPLNRLPGCSPLAGVCKKELHDGQVTYTNIGVAYDANFTSVHRDGEDRITLVYHYPMKSTVCPSVQTTIEFICNKSTLNLEVGPHYASGGDAQNPCQYTFIWETVGACPIQPITSSTCELKLPSGFTFDLSPLHSPNSKDPYQVKSESNNFSFDLAVCGSLSDNCNNRAGVTVCQTDSNGKSHACGLKNTQQLVYFDGSLYLKYQNGDRCHGNQKNRSVLINLECDRTANVTTSIPRYLQETGCAYSFEWPTPLACPPRELECVAGGGKYDLTPLLGNRKWIVDTGEVGGAFVYVLGGCRSLDVDQVPRCPQVPWMGACRYPSGNSSAPGSVLGYVTGDIVEESEGSLRLQYHNGDTCHGSRKSMVHIHFTCGLRSGSGVPRLASNSDSCDTHINWVTQYACSRNDKVTADWVLTDPVTSTVFNFTSLPSSLSRVYTTQDSIYRYTLSLRGGVISCNSGSSPSHGHPGACQVKISGGCIASNPRCVHTLGYLGGNSSSMSLIDGEVRAEYRNGDMCHHAAVARKTVILFECDKRGETFLEVMPENLCEYTFVVHTHLACTRDASIGVECQVEGFHDLVRLQIIQSQMVMVRPHQTAYISICSTLGPGVGRCVADSAACLYYSGKYINLGVPSSRYPLKALDDKTGVSIHYVEGDMCDAMTDTRWNTTILLICNRNIPVGVPEFVSSNDCQYLFRWETTVACPSKIPSSVSSNSACSLIDPYQNNQVLHFHAFINGLTLVTPDKHGGKYYIQLCGSASPVPPPSGCDQSNTGICQQSSDGNSHAIVYANHTFSLVSHSPRVVDVVFHSGVQCDSDRSRNWTATVQMMCSNRKETLVPVLASDSGCELNFAWRNQSFCAGESTSNGCTTTDYKTNYIYGMDGLLSQNWTGLVAPTVSNSPSAEEGGSFTLGICRNLNPFSYSGIHCSSPSAVCWHTPDGKHINLGRSSYKPEVVHGSSRSSIHIAYAHGDVCNATSGRQFHTDLYIHCANETSSPILFLHGDNSSADNNCSWVISMNSPFACRHQLSTNSCTIVTAAGKYNFTDIAQTPITLNSGSKQYSVCLCGNVSHPCKHQGIAEVVGDKFIDLGAFRNLSVTSSTGGPKLSYYGGSSCPDHGSTKYQSWLLMECDRSDTRSEIFTLLESASNDCTKVFVWYTKHACLSEQVSCSVAIQSHNSNLFFDFSPLHSNVRPWKVKSESSTYYINICGEIANTFADNIASCGRDSAVCVKTSDGQVYSIATASTQQFYYDNNEVVVKYTGPPSHLCREYSPKVSIMMKCGLSGLSFLSKRSECEYIFTWSSPYACKESIKPQVFTQCEDVMKVSDDFKFYPKKIARTEGYEYHGAMGRFFVNICAPSNNCNDKTASVCLDTTTTIASYSDQTIMIDGYQMLIQMNGGATTHAVIRVVCLANFDKDHDQVDHDQPLMLDNIAESGGHKYYYFTLYTRQGQGCDFKAPAPVTSPSGSTAVVTDKEGGAVVAKKGGGGVVVGIIISLVLVVIVLLLVVIFHKKSRREAALKYLVYLRVGKSSEPVRYHKVAVTEEEMSLMTDHSEDEDEEVEGREEGNVDRGENSDEELINL